MITLLVAYSLVITFLLLVGAFFYRIQARSYKERAHGSMERRHEIEYKLSDARMSLREETADRKAAQDRLEEVQANFQELKDFQQGKEDQAARIERMYKEALATLPQPSRWNPLARDLQRNPALQLHKDSLKALLDLQNSWHEHPVVFEFPEEGTDPEALDKAMEELQIKINS